MRSPNTFDSAAPRTYSIICISSESCLGSILGFARLPCFGTLHSAISAKVENYCDCVPVLPDEHLSRESRKLTVMIRRELVAERGLKSLKIFPASGEESTSSDLGMHSAPSPAFWIQGASPKFKILASMAK